MRTCTILFSIVAHAVVVFTVFVVSVTATDTLPDPRRAVDIVVVHAQLPTPPPRSPARTPRAEPPASALNTAPLEAPDGIQPHAIGIAAAFALKDEKRNRRELNRH